MLSSQKIIVTTQPLEDQELLAQKIKPLGYTIYSYPTIEISKTLLTNEQKEILKNIAHFDWIVFTSKNGVRYFLEHLQSLHIKKDILRSKKIGVIGPATAGEAKKNNITVDFIPSVFTTEKLGEELPDIRGKTILLPRADISSKTLPSLLQKRGAHAIDLPIYQTTYPTRPNKTFEKLVKDNSIVYIIFTSPSTIQGLMQHLSDDMKKIVLHIPILVIGPVTAQAAKDFKFLSIHIADTFTTKGLIKKLQKIL